MNAGQVPAIDSFLFAVFIVWTIDSSQQVELPCTITHLHALRCAQRVQHCVGYVFVVQCRHLVEDIFQPNNILQHIRQHGSGTDALFECIARSQFLNRNEHGSKLEWNRGDEL